MARMHIAAAVATCLFAALILFHLLISLNILPSAAYSLLSSSQIYQPGSPHQVGPDGDYLLGLGKADITG